MNAHYILAINPGSTSTKIALYRNEELLFKDNIAHAQEELDRYVDLMEQAPMRLKPVL